MTTPNLSICPYCGQEDFPLASRERLEGDSHITIDQDDDGSFTAEWGGDTDVDWDSSATLFYHCQACGKILPDGYATALDALLGNERVP